MKSLASLSKVLLLALMIGFGVSYAFATTGWQEPTQAPPGGNTPAPVNVGTVDQVKEAGLSLDKLAVFGQVVIQDGTQGAGKILTSDASGVASWTAGGGTSGVVWSGSRYIDALTDTSWTFTHNLGDTSYGVRLYFNPTTNSREGAMQIPVGLNGIDSGNNADYLYNVGLSARLYSDRVVILGPNGSATTHETGGYRERIIAEEWDSTATKLYYQHSKVKIYNSGYLFVDIVR